jgi:hypothetical protein
LKIPYTVAESNIHFKEECRKMCKSRTLSEKRSTACLDRGGPYRGPAAVPCAEQVSASELSVYLTGDDLDVARSGCSRLLLNVQYRT